MTTPDEQTLLPCPFCGGEAQSGKTDDNGGNTTFGVQGHSCGAEVGVWSHWHDDAEERQEKQAKAVDMWNTRAAMPDTKALEAAYMRGAMDVHNNFMPDRNPDFSEAASDYAIAARGGKA